MAGDQAAPAVEEPFPLSTLRHSVSHLMASAVAKLYPGVRFGFGPSIDHGFYYEDETLPVIVAPVRVVGHEWRFVIVRSVVVAGSAYDATTRSSVSDSPDSAAWSFAASVASDLSPPADVYILDICEADGDLRLLELNPFGGADLYACDPRQIIQAVSEVAYSCCEARKHNE